MIIPRKSKPPRLSPLGSSRPPGRYNSYPHPGNRERPHSSPPYRRFSPFDRLSNGNNKSWYYRRDSWKGNAGRNGGQFLNRGHGDSRNNHHVNTNCVTNYYNGQGRSFHRQSRCRPSGDRSYHNGSFDDRSFSRHGHYRNYRSDMRQNHDCRGPYRDSGYPCPLGGCSTNTLTQTFNGRTDVIVNNNSNKDNKILPSNDSEESS